MLRRMISLTDLLVGTAHAQVESLTPPPSCTVFFTTGMGAPGQGFVCVADYVGMLTAVIIGFAASICLILLVVNGIRYMVGPAFPGGSSDQAKKGITTALTGLGVCLLTHLILDTFIQLLTQ
jgi:hypothetical protein